MGQQIEIEGFTRTGFRVVVRDTAKNNDDAKRIIDSVGYMGLLPVRPEKPDELKYGRISHVALTHTEDGTPHIAFFHENEKLEKRWSHKYLNSETERNEFEAWAGVKLADMPAKEGNAHPQRDKSFDAKYFVALTSVRAVMRLTTYSKVTENGQDIWQPENDIERYIMPKGEPLDDEIRRRLKGDDKKDKLTGNWWESDAILKRIKEWHVQARVAKPKFIDIAMMSVAPMQEFSSAEDYIEAVKQIAANEEEKAKSEDIPF